MSRSYRRRTFRVRRRPTTKKKRPLMAWIRRHPRLTLWLVLLLPGRFVLPPFIEGYIAIKYDLPGYQLPDVPLRVYLLAIVTVELALVLFWANGYVKRVRKAGMETPTVNEVFGPSKARINFELGLRRAWRWNGAYWVEKRRATNVALQWPQVAKSVNLVRDLGVVKKTVQPHRAAFDANHDFSFRIYPGRLALSVETFEANTGLIAGSFDQCIEARLVRDEDGGEGKGTVQLWWSNPLARKTNLADLDVIKSDMLVSYGSRRDGTAALRKDRSAMFAGMTGQGKSNLIWVLLACLLAQGEWINLYVADNKGGIELPALEEFAGKLAAGPNHDPRATPAKGGPVYDPIFTKEGVQKGRLKVVAYVSDEDGDDTIEFLLPLALADLKRRRKWQRRPGGSRKLDRSSRECPLSIVLIDEVTLIDEELKKGTRSNIGKIMSGGRASLFAVWLCTQDARATTIPASLRTLIATRIGFKMDNLESINAVFGTDAVKRGAKCHLLHDINDRGVCFSMEEGRSIISRVRTPFVPDEATLEIARGEVPAAMVERNVTKTIPVVPYQEYRVDNTSPSWVAKFGGRPVYIGINHHGPKKGGGVRTWQDRFAEHMAAGSATSVVNGFTSSPEYAWCPLCEQKENWWAKHCDPNDPDVTVTVVDIDEGEAEARRQERRDIRVLHPVFNTQHNGAKRTWGERFTGWRELHSAARKSELVAAGAVGVDDEGAVVLDGDDGVDFDPNIDDAEYQVYDPRKPHTRQPIDGAWSE